MSQPAIIFDGVWKKFRRGERHDSLRDLIPATISRLRGRRDQSVLSDDEFWVLRDVSFALQPGEALGIIGQNGAGKSTSLKLLTRILKPTRGIARVHGRVGALIEVAAGFHPDLTGRENVFLQGAIMGMSRAETRRRFDEIVAFAGLDSFIDTPVKRYSSGMNARLGFAIAAHLEPDVLLIDEVLAVGDFTFQQKCYERLREFRRNGTAIAFVSHNMQAVAALCDRAMLLRAGQAPILGAVNDVLLEYGGNTTSHDHRVTVVSSQLFDAAGIPMTQTTSPGARLTLKATLQVEEDLPRAGVLFQVVRADGTQMFCSMSTLDGEPELSLRRGHQLETEISFSANLLRGTYSIDLQLLDSQRFWPTVVLPRLHTFVVSETNRLGGVAELAPTYAIGIWANRMKESELVSGA